MSVPMHPARSFSSENGRLEAKPSFVMFHDAEIPGNTPHWFPVAQRDEPS